MSLDSAVITGCLMGGTLGDAFGSRWEDRAPPTNDVLTSPGSVSDDTQLTIATCEALIKSGGVVPADVAACFTDWFRAGRLSGLGSSTLKALRDLKLGAHWALAGARGERAAGNGTAMRIAPLAFLLDPLVPADRLLLRDVCRITHHHDEAFCGAVAIATAIRLVCVEPTRTEALCHIVSEKLPDSLVRDRLRELSLETGSPSDVGRRFGTTGYVVDSVPLAIYASQRVAGASFEAVLESILRAGGDSDTMGALTGQIAGAYLGRSGLPPAMVDAVSGMEWIEPVVAAFAHKFGDSALILKFTD